MKYNPGTHLIASLTTASQSLVRNFDNVQHCINGLIKEFGLQKLGEVYHNFPSGGYTAVVCLSESHISIHTWPEHDLVNLDIYLSNFQRNNDGTVNKIFDTLTLFFNASINHQQIIIR